jgi:branched-chain amino acid transport system permease protein
MHLELSILIALMAMLGGAASLWGPIIGAAILVPLDRYLGSWIGGVKELLGLDLVIYSIVIMLIAAVEPRGIWGMVEKAREKRR